MSYDSENDANEANEVLKPVIIYLNGKDPEHNVRFCASLLDMVIEQSFDGKKDKCLAIVTICMVMKGRINARSK